MTNDFKQRLVNYQQTGDRLIIDEILYGATFDFSKDPTREVFPLKDGKVHVNVKLSRPEHYIGYRVRRLKKGALRDYIGERLDETAKELNRLLSMIYIDFRIDFGCEYTDFDGYLLKFKQDATLFACVDASMDRIKRELYATELPYFLEFYEYAKRRYMEREERRLEVEQGVNENIVASIERALGYVDVSKSEREIIVYMNKAITSKFGELELRRNGMKRIYRHNNSGDSVTLYVKKKFPEDSYNAIIPEFSASKVERLTKKQRELVAELIKIIDRDRRMCKFDGYSCDRRGYAIIKRDYAAKELRIDYTNLRKLLSRIKKKSQSSVF